MAFWGVEVTPGKVAPFVPPPEGSKLHLSQVQSGSSFLSYHPPSVEPIGHEAHALTFDALQPFSTE